MCGAAASSPMFGGSQTWRRARGVKNGVDATTSTRSMSSRHVAASRPRASLASTQQLLRILAYEWSRRLEPNVRQKSHVEARARRQKRCGCDHKYTIDELTPCGRLKTSR